MPPAQGYGCVVAVFPAFGRAISVLLAYRARQSCQSKPILGCRKLNPLLCGVRSSALFVGSKTMNGHPNQIFWGDLSLVGGDIKKKTPPQPMISLISACIFESPIFFFRNQFSFSANPLGVRLVGGLLSVVPLRR